MNIKALVETVGDFQLVDFNHNRQTVPSERPAVVVLSKFIQERVSAGQIRVITQVGEEATDDEFLNYWKESENPELAVDSFITTFPDGKPTQKTVKAAEPKQRKKKVAEE